MAGWVTVADGSVGVIGWGWEVIWTWIGVEVTLATLAWIDVEGIDLGWNEANLTWIGDDWIESYVGARRACEMGPLGVVRG